MAVNYLFGKNGFWKRLVFCGKLRLLLGHMPFAVWLDLDWFQKKNRKFPVVGAVNLEYLPRLKKRLGTSRIGARNLGRVIDIDTVHFPAFTSKLPRS